MQSSSIKIFFVYLTACLIWGSTWLAIRIGLEDLTPLVSAGYRFVLASIFILFLMRIRSVKLDLQKISVRLYVIMGLFSFSIPFGFVYWAEQFVPSGLAAVLFAVYPFFITIYSYFFIPGEKINFYKISGILLGFSGIVIIFSDQIGGDFTLYLAGMLLIVFSAMMQAGVAVVIKKFGQHLNPLSINLLPMFIGGILMLAYGFITEDTSNLNYTAGAVGSILYLALFGSVVTFTSYYWLLQRVSIVILSLIAFITPVIAVFIGWILYSEELNANDITGSAVVLAGLIAANTGNIINHLKKTDF